MTFWNVPAFYSSVPVWSTGIGWSLERLCIYITSSCSPGWVERKRTQRCRARATVNLTSHQVVFHLLEELSVVSVSIFMLPFPAGSCGTKYGFTFRRAETTWDLWVYALAHALKCEHTHTHLFCLTLRVCVRVWLVGEDSYSEPYTAVRRPGDVGHAETHSRNTVWNHTEWGHITSQTHPQFL